MYRQNRQAVAEISHLTIFKMAAVHHLGFLFFLIFGHPSGWDG